MSASGTPRTEAGRAARLGRRRRLVAAIAITCAVVVAVGIGAWVLRTYRPTVAAPTCDAVSAAEPTAALEPTAAIEPTLPPEPSDPATITIAAVGDMQFDRQVKRLISTSGGTAPLEKVAPELAAADIAVGNLESPLSNRGTLRTDKEYTFRGDPRAVEGLAAAGFDFLALANNHTLDCGNDALSDTIALLNERGIGHAGAGANKTEAWTPAVRDVNGTTIAFLSFSHVLPNGFIATNTRPGIAQGRQNMDEVENAIRAADATYDYVIVSFHWGVENVDDCNAEQVRDAHRAIDAGADIVIAHHPHVIQAVEYYNDRLIAYSLGDFVFDHYSRKTGEAFILEAELGPAGITNARIKPVYLDAQGSPGYVTGDAAATILDRLMTISAKRGTTVERTGDTAAVLK